MENFFVIKILNNILLGIFLVNLVVFSAIPGIWVSIRIFKRAFRIGRKA